MNEEYKQYLKSDHWRNLKKAAFLHYGQICNFCKSTTKLDMHHLRYQKPLESAKIDDLIPLCRKCHKKAHKFMRKEENKALSRDSLNILVSQKFNKFIKKQKKSNLQRIKNRLKKIDELTRKENKLFKDGFKPCVSMGWRRPNHDYQPWLK